MRKKDFERKEWNLCHLSRYLYLKKDEEEKNTLEKFKKLILKTMTKTHS